MSNVREPGIGSALPRRSDDERECAGQLELRLSGQVDEDDRIEVLTVDHQPHTLGDSPLARLYSRPITARRAGPFYNAFSYPTKIDPEAIAIFIAAHTSPGDTVLDVFAGSGTTGLAVGLCGNPTDAMRRHVKQLGLDVEWGPRSAILYEVSVVGSLLAKVMCDPPEAIEFASVAHDLVGSVLSMYGWMYDAESPDGSVGWIRHSIWSDVVVCDKCENHIPYWDLAVLRSPLKLLSKARCRHCHAEIDTGPATRAVEPTTDPLTGNMTSQRVRRLAHVYGQSGRYNWHRPPVPTDFERLDRVLNTEIPSIVPSDRLRWGDLYRSGYHQGIDRIHHFYTRRNLIAFGALWEAVERQPGHLRDPLRLLLLSYNAAHATLMTRVVVKDGLKDFVVTGAQTGVLYVSSLPVEKNIFHGVARKINTFTAAFSASERCDGAVQVVNASSTELDLPDRSVDYVFTDPPFGGFIPYAEINQINEMWLGSVTETTEEAIISRAQGKGVAEYTELMKRVFLETCRVMKDHAVATVVFHSSKPEVWQALSMSFAHANLTVMRTSLLDKIQGTFKQVVSVGATRGDAVFLLSKGRWRQFQLRAGGLEATIAELRHAHGNNISPQHLFARYVARCMEEGRPVEVSAGAFYATIRASRGEVP